MLTVALDSGVTVHPGRPSRPATRLLSTSGGPAWCDTLITGRLGSWQSCASVIAISLGRRSAAAHELFDALRLQPAKPSCRDSALRCHLGAAPASLSPNRLISGRLAPIMSMGGPVGGCIVTTVKTIGIAICEHFPARVGNAADLETTMALQFGGSASAHFLSR